LNKRFGTYIVLSSFLLTVKNGSAEAKNGYTFIVGKRNESIGNLTIESGNYKGITSAVTLVCGTVTINGGYFEGTEYNGAHEFTLNCIDDLYLADKANVIVNGGTFYKFNPANNAAEGANTNFVADGYLAVENADGIWTVKYDGTEVSSVAELKDALSNGGNVLLTSDIKNAKGIAVPAGATATLNLNGKTISTTSNYAIDNEGTLIITGSGKLEAEECAVFNFGGDVIIDGDIYDSDFYAVTIKGGNIKNCTFDSFDVTGGTFKGCTFTSNGFYSGGTFDFNPPAGSLNPNHYVVDNGNGTWTVVADYEAFIGETGFLTFYDVLNEVKDDETIVVAKNIDFLGGYEIYNKNITIDLNGKTVTAGKEYPSACINGVTNGYVFKVTGTSNVTFKNGILSGPNGKVTSDGTATFTLDNVQ